MNLIKPANLNYGDTIGIIAPAGVAEPNEIMKAKRLFENLGYKIKIGEHVFDSNRYMAGTDEVRLKDLHDAFENNEIKAILCARGGYGSIRIINSINYDLIRKNPKIFCGYSDITALSLMFLKKSGLVTFSAPMAQSDFNTETPCPKTLNSFLNILNGVKETYSSTKTIIPGESKGILWGGNLSTIVSLCGADFIPEQDFIFFTEDVNEPAYKIDKMLCQLTNISNFRQHIKGVAFGEFLNCDNKEWLEEILEEFANKLNIPAYTGFNITHGEYKQSVPIGLNALLDGNINILD